MSDLENAADNLITIQQTIISKLDEIIAAIETHHRNCNISKSVGAGAGVLGTAALITAPFTAGLSLIVAKAGIAAMVAGATTSIGTSIADIFKSKGFMDEVNEQVKTQKTAAEELNNMVENVRSIVISFSNEIGCTEEEAWPTVLRALFVGGNGMMTTVSSISVVNSALKATKFAADMIAIEKAGASIGLSVITRIPAGASAETIAAMGRASYQIGRTATITTGQAVAIAVSKTLVVLGSLVDVAFTIHGWATEHPTLQGIREVRDKLRESISQLVKFKEALAELNEF